MVLNHPQFQEGHRILPTQVCSPGAFCLRSIPDLVAQGTQHPGGASLPRPSVEQAESQRKVWVSGLPPVTPAASGVSPQRRPALPRMVRAANQNIFALLSKHKGSVSQQPRP